MHLSWLQLQLYKSHKRGQKQKINLQLPFIERILKESDCRMTDKKETEQRVISPKDIDKINYK